METSRLFALFILASLALMAPAAAEDEESHPAAGSREEVQLPERSMTVKPWKASIERLHEAELAIPRPRPDHYLWSPEVLREAKQETLTNPEIPRGRDLEDAEQELEVEDFGGLATPRAPGLKGRFYGLEIVDTGFGNSLFFPPDTNVGVSRSKVIQVTNVAARLSDRDGKNEEIRSLHDFFAVDEPTLFDPKVYFDRLSERFLLVTLSGDFDRRKSHIYVAVSRSDDPQSLAAPSEFCTYRINAKRSGTWADYPGIGVNESWFVVSVNNFSFSSENFKAVYLYAMEVAALTNNAASCPKLKISRFKVAKDPAGVPAFTLQPAQHYTPSGLPGTPFYLLSTQPLFVGDRYMLARIEASGGGKPSLSKQLLQATTFFVPPNVTQKNNIDLDTGDMRVMQAAFRDGVLWAVMSVACSIGGGDNESCIRAIQVTPGGSGAAITLEDTFGKKNWYFYWPGVAVNSRGDVAVSFLRSKDGRFLGTAFNGKRAAQSTFDSGVRKLRNGTCSIDRPNWTVERTGDYTGTQTDPLDDLSFFVAGEFATPFPTSSGGTRCEWATRVGRVRY